MFKVTAAHSSLPSQAKINSPCRAWSARQLIAVAALLVALAAASLLVDTAIARMAKERGFPGELRRLIRLSEFFGWGGTVALVIVAAAMLDPRGWRAALPLATAAYGSGILADGAKLLVARLRPIAATLDRGALGTFVAWLPLFHKEELGRSYGYALQSFPSAHAATAAGLAVGLATLYPRGRWLFAICAVLASLQRIEAEAHFLSDVLCGAAIGCLIGAATGYYLAPGREPGPTSGAGGLELE